MTHPTAVGHQHAATGTDAQIDPGALTAGGYPIQVLTSGRTAGFEAIAEAIAEQTGARHFVVTDTDHLIQNAGGPVNELLEQLWLRADAERPG